MDPHLRFGLLRWSRRPQRHTHRRTGPAILTDDLTTAAARSHRNGQTVAVVGGGASGMLVAIRLLYAAANAGRTLRIILTERCERLGGIAYSTTDPDHRLNVAACGMSAFAEIPEHFVRWRDRFGSEGGPGAYAPRSEYGDYLADTLAVAQRRVAPSVSLVRLVAEVDAVQPSQECVTLHLSGGRAITADLAVLALGNLAAAPPPGCEALVGHPGYVDDPWSRGGLERLSERADGDAVLLIGTGLTMVDVSLSLARRWPGRRLIALSRAGLLPRAHLPGAMPPPPAPTRADPHVSFAELVDRVLAEAAQESARWRQLADGLRPVTQAHWRRLSFGERAAFMATRHRSWSVHRHRMAPEVAARLATLLESGSLEVGRGTPSFELSEARRLAVRLPDGERVALALAVNCTGPTLDPGASDDPLVRQLLADEQARRHPVGIGFDTAPSGAFRRGDGTPQERLLTLGPPRIGDLYETTAIPEIRAQARDVALGVIARLDESRERELLRAQIG